MTAQVLHGDLKHFFPSEILQLLALAQATGRLELDRAGERAEIFVERGRPVFARTDGPSVRLGEWLAHRGVVSAETIEHVLARSGREAGWRLGERLVAAGVATPSQVQSAIRELLQRVLYGLLLWRDGAFRFVPGERPAGEDVRLDLDLDRLILEGLRQADESRAG